jgi:hemoglobin-like flavoprotein
MTPEQIRLVQESFRLVLPIRDAAAALFYGKLFELDPGTRNLFAATDLKSQGAKLMAAIGMVVGALNAPAAMLGKVKEMARRHVGYGVEEAHYATVGAALIWTLETGLGEKFTAELRAAWIAAYTLLSTVMIEAAREVAVAKAA